MIVGIGTDIVKIDRVLNAIKNEKFIDKLYSEKEKELIKIRKSISASNFCVKESFVKALGTGFRGINAKEIEVLRDDFDKPYISLLGDLKIRVGEDINIFVTISHTDEHVTSTVILENVQK